MNWQLAPNDPLLEKYRIERCLGVGGMGAVFEAQHLQLQHRVAIKLLYPELETRPDVVARFLREGRATARLRSPHVVRVLDVGRGLPGSAFLVMEYLEGEDLEGILKRRGALPLSEAVEYLLQVCEAMYEAHGMGIVHRDLKPANLFLARDLYGNPCIKVLDFGISKVSRETEVPDLTITANATVVGTPLYMPPEQMRGTDLVDGRADIWALGAILYELVTGKPAWSGSTLSEICVRVAADPTPRALELAPELPAKVDFIVSRCLEKDVQARYADVNALAVDLAELAPAAGALTLARLQRLQEVALSEKGLSTTRISAPMMARTVVDGDVTRSIEALAGKTEMDVVVCASEAAAVSDRDRDSASAIRPVSDRRAKRHPFRAVAAGLVLCATGVTASAAWGGRSDVKRWVAGNAVESRVSSQGQRATSTSSSSNRHGAARADDGEMAVDRYSLGYADGLGRTNAVPEQVPLASQDVPLASQGVPRVPSSMGDGVRVVPIASPTVVSTTTGSTRSTADSRSPLVASPRVVREAFAPSSPRRTPIPREVAPRAVSKAAERSGVSNRERFAPDWGGRK
jgi:serine/threonine-protein kinase